MAKRFQRTAVSVVAAVVAVTLLVGCSKKVDLNKGRERAPDTTVSTGPEHP